MLWRWTPLGGRRRNTRKNHRWATRDRSLSGEEDQRGSSRSFKLHRVTGNSVVGGFCGVTAGEYGFQ
jgi:hypothetical protein